MYLILAYDVHTTYITNIYEVFITNVTPIQIAFTHKNWLQQLWQRRRMLCIRLFKFTNVKIAFCIILFWNEALWYWRDVCSWRDMSLVIGVIGSRTFSWGLWPVSSCMWRSMDDCIGFVRKAFRDHFKNAICYCIMVTTYVTATATRLQDVWNLRF